MWTSRKLGQTFLVNLVVIEESLVIECALRAVRENEVGYVFKLHFVTPTYLSSTSSLMATRFRSKHRLLVACMSFIVVVTYYLWFATLMEFRP